MTGPGDWREELARAPDAAAIFGSVAGLDPAVAAYAARLSAEGSFPMRATPYYLSLAEPKIGDPILRQVIPDPAEAIQLPCEAPDPLAEGSHAAGGRVVRQYASRLLLRAGGPCAANCRHCFRKALLPSEGGFIGDAEADAAAAFLRERPEIREILVSGGEPLAASDGRVERLLASLRRASPRALIRICTRSPVTLPSRFEPALVGILRAARPLVVATHANCARELSPAFREAVGLLIDSGIPVLNQAVLLRGVNDSADALEALFSSLWNLGVEPYYLFQGDLASGTSHLRAPIDSGLAIYAELRRRLSGAELPRYAVDLPGGLGKAYLPEDIVHAEEGAYLIRSAGGREARYPRER